jgi:HEAT repeat protein
MDSETPSHVDPNTQVSVEQADRALSLIGKLPVGSPIRRIALSLIRGERLNSVQELLGALRDGSLRNWRESVAASWVIGNARLSPQDADAAAAGLLDVLENNLHENPWRVILRVMGWSFLAALVPWIGLFVSGESGGNGAPPVLLQPFILALPMMIVGAPIAVIHEKTLRNKVRAAAAKALGALALPESVGALSNALFDRGMEVRISAAEALHSVLPKLNASHFGRLGAESMRSLGKALTYADSQLVAEVLEALRHVGTGAAIPYVERIREKGRTLRLRDSAAEILEILHERQRTEQQSDRLLRSTQTPTNPGEHLLRAARDSVEASSVQLLRPSSEDKN